MEKTPDELYQERLNRLETAIQLEEPDRIPIMPFFTFFPATYSGITFQEAMYDYNKLRNAAKKTYLDFQPDFCQNLHSIIAVGKVFELLGYKQLKWPGQDLAASSSYQFVEDEYMKPDEYDEFISDLSGFMLRKFYPRTISIMEPLEGINPIPWVYYHRIIPGVAALGSVEFEETLRKLLEAGTYAREVMEDGREFLNEMASSGFPCQFGASINAPFDYISDFFRGTRGAMLDMYRNSDQLLEAVEKVLPIMLEAGITAAEKSGVPRVFIPLHKGAEGFMSQDQFITFYWPTLRKLTIGLIDAGLTPCLFFEGDVSSRLEIISDIPKGKAIYWFERTDIFKAKEVVGNNVCIKGNVPASLLCTGSIVEVEDYCKRLIDNIGRNGGFIMDGGVGVPDEAKPENVHAMINYTKENGRYR